MTVPLESDPTDGEYAEAKHQAKGWEKGITDAGRAAISEHDLRALVDAIAFACARSRTNAWSKPKPKGEAE